jgi:protein-disulfide isomerase
MTLGFDPASFIGVMQGAETLRRVHADVEEGIALGLHYTPMIFINGVELKGWNSRDALTRTVEQVAASSPPARTAAADRPVLAAEKYVQDWIDQPVRPMPADARQWALTRAPAGGRSVEVVVFGDYQEPNTAEMDRTLRELVGSQPSVRYVFRHYPIDPPCNPSLQALHPRACWAARMAEGAGQIGGEDAYWKVHEWLFSHPKELTDEALRPAVEAMGLSWAELIEASQSPEVTTAIAEDARAGQRLGLTGVPMVFVDARFVPRATREGKSILPELVSEAMKSRRSGSKP